MADKEEMLRQIIDDIEAGFVDDPLEDYNYLKTEIENYKEHELAEDIYQAVGKMMYKDIPTTVRKGLKEDLTGDIQAYNFFINEADSLMAEGQWATSVTILENLMGDGIGVDDTPRFEYRTMEDEIQQILYTQFFKSESKNVELLPVNFGKLYGLYGCALVEAKEFENAEKVLEEAVHYNPLDFRFFFEYTESMKVQGKLGVYEQLSRNYIQYAYRAADIGHLYRNLGYVYIEKKDFETAGILYKYSQAYDPESAMARQELEYIENLTGTPIKEPSQEEANAVMTREAIPVGASEEVVKILYRNAFLASLKHNIKKTEYFCTMLFDVTRNEKLVNELLEKAKEDPKGSGGILSSLGSEPDPVIDTITPYKKYRDKSLKEVFPDLPTIEECRIRITFTINSVKYEETVYQILTHIDDMSKLIDGKNVTVYFADLQSALNNFKFINDLLAIAGGWKSFKLTINDKIRNKDEFRYFIDYLGDELNQEEVRQGGGSAEELRKIYKRETASETERARKEKVEDGFKVNLEGCTPQEIVTGIATTYVNVYLSECDVKAIRVSEDEIVLSANDDFVVDIWVSPYGYGATMDGKPEPDDEPYKFCTYIIQELSRNNIFKYNAAGFKRIFDDPFLNLQTLKFNAPDSYPSTVNHFHKIDEAYPELRLKEKYEEYKGEPYSFIVFEMENADGSVGTGIGYTDKKARALLLKVCKELETRTNAYLEDNTANGLLRNYSQSFIKAFLSWKGEKKTQRLEKHLKYYCIEKTLKDKNGCIYEVKRIMEDVKSGKNDEIKRSSYADIGRR